MLLYFNAFLVYTWAADRGKLQLWCRPVCQHVVDLVKKVIKTVEVSLNRHFHLFAVLNLFLSKFELVICSIEVRMEHHCQALLVCLGCSILWRTLILLILLFDLLLGHRNWLLKRVITSNSVLIRRRAHITNWIIISIFIYLHIVHWQAAQLMESSAIWVRRRSVIIDASIRGSPLEQAVILIAIDTIDEV